MTKQDIKTTLTNEKERLEALLKAWQAVKRVKTKGGNDFKTFSMNFKYVRHGLSGEGRIIYIDTYTESKTFVMDFINVDRGDTIDETFTLIQKHISYYRGDIESINNQLNNIDDLISKADEIIQQAKRLLKDDRLQNRNYDFEALNSLGYKIQDYISTNIHL